MIPGLNKRVFNFYDLMLYVALVRKHLRLMILLMCMSLMAGLVVYVYSRPVYFSDSIVDVDSLGLPLDTDKIYHDGNLSAVISELRSQEVMQRTATRLGAVTDGRDILTKYIREIKFAVTSAGNLEVAVYSYEPNWPARWTPIMIEEFMRLRAERREEYRNTVMRAYGQELNLLKEKIDTNEDSKFQFEDRTKTTQAMIDVDRLRNVPEEIAIVKERMDRIDEVTKRLDNPNIDVVDRLSIIAAMDVEAPVTLGQTANTQLGRTGTAAQAAGIRQVDPASATAEDSVIVPGIMDETQEWQHLEKDQRELLEEKADLSRIYLPGNQKMSVVQKKLDENERSLQLDYQIARNRLDIVSRSLQDRYSQLQNELPEYERANRDFAKIQEDAQLQQAGQLAWSGYYGDAGKTINALQFTASDKEKVNLHFDHTVEVRGDPVAPNKAKLIILSLLVGIMMSFAVPFLIEYLDYTLSNIEEVEETFQLRGLGIIPQMINEEKTSLLLSATSSHDQQNLIENFRVVRTNLLAMGALSKPAHVTMVTSAMPKEGKTVVASNLAISFAQTGVRTLLVDTDMRRGRLHRLFGLRKSPGLSDFLLEKVSLSEAIRPSGKENLSILSAGQHVETGTELLGSAKFLELMRSLRDDYERIIVDTPPVLGLSETSVLQNVVDGVLFVIWSGRTPIRNMKTAIDILSANGANFYGFILNRLDLNATANYYQYYYYSSDYYHSYHAIENA